MLARLDETVSFEPWHGTAPPLFDTWVRMPEPALRGAPPAQRMVSEIRRMTAWSDRRLADVLRSTHPTVSAVATGRSTALVGDLHTRIASTLDVVERIFLVADQNAHETNRLMSTVPPGSDSDAASMLADGSPAAAYLAALAVHQPPRSSGMMRGIWPAQAGQADTELNVL